MGASLSELERKVLEAFRNHGDLPGDPPYAEYIAVRIGNENVGEVADVFERLADREPPLVERAGKEQATFPFGRYYLTSEGLRALEE